MKLIEHQNVLCLYDVYENRKYLVSTDANTNTNADTKANTNTNTFEIQIRFLVPGAGTRVRWGAL